MTPQINCLGKLSPVLRVSFSIVVTLQLTIFMGMPSLQYTILKCHKYIFSVVKLSQFLQLPPPLVTQGRVTYLVKTRQVIQMSYAALYKHVALFVVTIYKYVHTSPHHIFLHQIYKNAMRTISTPDQSTHIPPSTI